MARIHWVSTIAGVGIVAALAFAWRVQQPTASVAAQTASAGAPVTVIEAPPLAPTIALLAERTEDGFVFRVDMRLRPYGEGGALALAALMVAGSVGMVRAVNEIGKL